MISKLYAAHQGGDKNSGFDNEGEGAAVKDVVAAGILDLYLAKWWGIKLATGAAVTVLRVDQVSLSLSLPPFLSSTFSDVNVHASVYIGVHACIVIVLVHATLMVCVCDWP